MSAVTGNGGALHRVLERWAAHPAVDDALEARVAAARDAVSDELDTDPWRD